MNISEATREHLRRNWNGNYSKSDFGWWFCTINKKTGELEHSGTSGVFSCTDSLQYLTIEFFKFGHYNKKVHKKDFKNHFYVGIKTSALIDLAVINSLEKKHGIFQTKVEDDYYRAGSGHFTVLKLSKQWITSPTLLHAFGWVLRSSYLALKNKKFNLKKKFSFEIYHESVRDFLSKENPYSIIGYNDLSLHEDRKFLEKINTLLQYRRLFSLKYVFNTKTYSLSKHGGASNGLKSYFRAYDRPRGSRSSVAGGSLSKMLDTYQIMKDKEV